MYSCIMATRFGLTDVICLQLAAVMNAKMWNNVTIVLQQLVRLLFDIDCINPGIFLTSIFMIIYCAVIDNIKTLLKC